VRVSPAVDIRFPADEAVVARLIARLDDYDLAAIHEIDPDDTLVWRVFFPGAASRDAVTAALDAEFAASGVTLEPVDVPDDDWAARSQAALTSIRVGRIVVAPPWDVPAPGSLLGAPASAAASDVLILIQPSMGFGTGHHETTRLCLALLQDARVADRDVLDVGTGSGVLAIAAALLGARSVRAIDVDDDALESARENVALNDAPLAARGVRPAIDAGNLRDGSQPADLVIANLTGGLLVAAAAPLLAAVRPGGQLLVSGFQPHEADRVLAAIAIPGARVEHRREGEWEAALIVSGRG
jgi:ribosomal protein L11 methyltransferase